MDLNVVLKNNEEVQSFPRTIADNVYIEKGVTAKNKLDKFLNSLYLIQSEIEVENTEVQ